MIKLFLSVTFATALMGLVAYGQTSTSSTTVATGTNGATETTTTTTEITGTVTEFTPGQTLILKTEAADPVRYKFGKTVCHIRDFRWTRSFENQKRFKGSRSLHQGRRQHGR